MVDVLRVQLAALRAQVGCIQAQIEAMGEMLELGLGEPQAQECPHLETENTGTFGAPELRCTVCKAVVG